MRLMLTIFFACCVYTNTLAQIQVGQIRVGVCTDRSVYQYGDPVNITVTAYNLTSDTVILNFLSPCPANYSIDNEFHVFCIMCICPSSTTIPPHGTASWNFQHSYHPPLLPPLSIGSHVVVGTLYPYGISLPVNILVSIVTAVDNLTPDGFLLGQNYPNPFNGVTWVPFTLALPGRVKIDVLNFLGQSVRTILDDYYTSGSHLVRVDLNDVSNGLYWCRLETGGRAQTIRLVLSK